LSTQKSEASKIVGLTKGQPRKATARPTAEALLQSFTGQSMFRADGQWHQTPLTDLQRNILNLLNFSEDIYHCLTTPMSEVLTELRET
jgi:hypothetical protein